MMDKNRFNEDNIWKMLRDSAEDVEVPESLSPENILKKLEQQEAEKAGAAMNEEKKKVESQNHKKKTNWKKFFVRVVETAAVLAVTFVVGYQVRELDLQRDVKTVAEEQVAEETAADVQVVEDTAAEEQVVEDTAAEVQVVEEIVEEAQNAVTDEVLATAADSTDLYEKLWAYQSLRGISNMLGGSSKGTYDVMMLEESMEIASTADSGMTTSMAAQSESGSGANEFSQTNLRDSGVDEGDIVKTDGEYLYIMNHSRVRIVRVDGAQMEEIAVIEPENLSEYIEDMYVDGDHLILITTGTVSSMQEEEADIYTVKEYDYVKAITYDITDREEPKAAGAVEQEGYYRSSRKTGDYLYLFSTFTPQLENSEEDSDIMPLLNGSKMAASSIYVPEYLANTSYLVMSSVNIQNPSETVDSKAVVSGADNFYVSGKNIYIYNEEWKNSRTSTHILKFHYEDGKITGVGAGKVNGYLNDSFSIDEYDGYLRVVTTDWVDSEDVNALYVLDDKLQLVGQIEDLAPDETIRSARFMGDTGYFVTFRQMDPLFSVDLSDPTDPKILGELKISGFSSYLHFYGEDQLLGIGYEADKDTGVTTGVKLSMFDISDPSDVKETKKYVIKDANYLPLDQDYKAVMIAPEKNLFGFVCDSQYLVFSYDETDGFQNELTYSLAAGEESYWYSYDGYRGLYINDYFYLAEESEVLAFDMTDDFALAAKLELQ